MSRYVLKQMFKPCNVEPKFYSTAASPARAALLVSHPITREQNNLESCSQKLVFTPATPQMSRRVNVVWEITISKCQQSSRVRSKGYFVTWQKKGSSAIIKVTTLVHCFRKVTEGVNIANFGGEILMNRRGELGGVRIERQQYRRWGANQKENKWRFSPLTSGQAGPERYGGVRCRWGAGCSNQQRQVGTHPKQ